MSGYLPDQADVRDRVSGGAARARGAGYAFPPEHVTADGIEVHIKLLERATRDGKFGCYLCGRALTDRNEWHLDHVIPLVLRGPHAVSNLEAACAGCNLGKGGLSLEEFLTPTEYAQFMAGGGPPPFQLMRHRPIVELWMRSPAIARRFARRPREVPFALWGHNWYNPTTHQNGVDGAIAAELRGQGPNRARAMSVADLAVALSLKSKHSLEDNYWLRAMGLNDRTNNTTYHNNRLWPSPLIMPVRMGIHDRRIGFRLRLGPPLDLRPRSERSIRDGQDGIRDRTEQTDLRRFPDQDEV
jgi:hypothetical protein